MSWITLCLGIVIVLVRTAVAHSTPSPPSHEQPKAVVNGGATYYNYPHVHVPVGHSGQDKRTQNSVYYGYFLPPGAHFHHYYNNPYLGVDPYNYHDDSTAPGDALYTDYYGEDSPLPDYGNQDEDDSGGQVEEVVHGVSDGGGRKDGGQGDETYWRKYFGIGEGGSEYPQVDSGEDHAQAAQNYPHQPDHVETRAPLAKTTPTQHTPAAPMLKCGPVGQIKCSTLSPCHYRRCVAAVYGSDTYKYGQVMPCPRGTAIRSNCTNSTGVVGSPCTWDTSNICTGALYNAPQEITSEEPLQVKYESLSTQRYTTKSNNPYNTPESTPPSPTPRPPFTTHQPLPHTTKSELVHTAPVSEHPLHTTIKTTQSPYTSPRETTPYPNLPIETIFPPTYPKDNSGAAQTTYKPTHSTKLAHTNPQISSTTDWYMKYLLGPGDELLQESDSDEGFENAAVETTQSPRLSTPTHDSGDTDRSRSGFPTPTSRPGSGSWNWNDFMRFLDTYHASLHGSHGTANDDLDREGDTVEGTGNPPYGAYGIFDPLSTKPTPAIQPNPELPTVGSEQNNQDTQTVTESTDEPFESVNVYDANQEYYYNNYFYGDYQRYDY